MRIARNVMFAILACVTLATGAVTRAYEYYNGPCSFDSNCDCRINYPVRWGEQGQMWFNCYYEECGSEVCSGAYSDCTWVCAGSGVMSFNCDTGACYGDCTCWPLNTK